MAVINFNKAEFIKTAASSKQFINTSIPVVAFAGKSNVGKSSVINRIVNRKNFARVGNTPGKTQNINYFNIDDKLIFADLPGYGFAKVSQQERDRWAGLMESFFKLPDNINLGVLIVDARHKPTADDIRMAGWFKESGKKFIVLANKIDKLNKTEASACEGLIRSCLDLDEAVSVILFSAEKGNGRDAVITAISQI